MGDLQGVVRMNAAMWVSGMGVDDGSEFLVWSKLRTCD